MTPNSKQLECRSFFAHKPKHFWSLTSFFFLFFNRLHGKMNRAEKTLLIDTKSLSSALHVSTEREKHPSGSSLQYHYFLKIMFKVRLWLCGSAKNPSTGKLRKRHVGKTLSSWMRIHKVFEMSVFFSVNPKKLYVSVRITMALGAWWCLAPLLLFIKAVNTNNNNNNNNSLADKLLQHELFASAPFE